MLALDSQGYQKENLNISVETTPPALPIEILCRYSRVLSKSMQIRIFQFPYAKLAWKRTMFSRKVWKKCQMSQSTFKEMRVKIPGSLKTSLGLSWTPWNRIRLPQDEGPGWCTMPVKGHRGLEKGIFRKLRALVGTLFRPSQLYFLGFSISFKTSRIKMFVLNFK